MRAASPSITPRFDPLRVLELWVDTGRNMLKFVSKWRRERERERERLKISLGALGNMALFFVVTSF